VVERIPILAAVVVVPVETVQLVRTRHLQHLETVELELSST
jgi:hypothetical protein